MSEPKPVLDVAAKNYERAVAKLRKAVAFRTVKQRALREAVDDEADAFGAVKAARHEAELRARELRAVAEGVKLDELDADDPLSATVDPAPVRQLRLFLEGAEDPTKAAAPAPAEEPAPAPAG